MSDSHPSSLPPITPGTRLGPNRIQRVLGASESGEYFEVTVGTTMHYYELWVLSDKARLSHADVEKVVRPLAAIYHPCLSKPYACGCDEGRVWIRSELPQSVPLGSFNLPPTDRKLPWPVGEMVDDAGRLRSLFNGLVPQVTLWPLVADLMEGLASLHKAGIKAGPFGLESVVFQKGRHGKGVVAKWAKYGLRPLFDPEGAASADLRDDVRSAGDVIRWLLCGESGNLPVSAWPEWEAFLSRTQEGEASFADGVVLQEAFQEFLLSKRLEREPRQAEAEPAADAVHSSNPSSQPRQHEQRKRVGANRRRSSEGASSSTMSDLIMGPAFKVIFMIAALCVVGFAAYWLVSREARLRREGLVGESVRIVSEADGSEVSEEREETLWNLSRDVLRERSAAGNPLASIRLASLMAQGDSDHEADEAGAAKLATPAVAKLEEKLAGGEADADTRYWLGYALLTGLGTEIDATRGTTLLEGAAREGGHVRAMDLLGDYLASGLAGNPDVDDRVALQWWRTAIDAHAVWNPHVLEMANKAMEFIMAGRGLPRGDPSSFVAWVEKLARVPHGPSIMAMGTILLEGKIISMNAPQAMRWFRTAALGGIAGGMRRIAWMFERGVGTPQADQTARLWFRRAAVAGDPIAMERMAELIEEGKGGEDADAEEAAEWRRKAAEARAREQAEKRRFEWWKFGQTTETPAPPYVQLEPALPAGTPGTSDTSPVPAPLPPVPSRQEPPDDKPPDSVPLPPVHPGLIDPSGKPVPLG